MAEQDNANSSGVRVIDALNMYYSEFGLPDSLREEMAKTIINGLKKTADQGGGIVLGNYGIEVYESGSEYYVDSEVFNYVMGQIRLNGKGGYGCRLESGTNQGNEEGKE